MKLRSLNSLCLIAGLMLSMAPALADTSFADFFAKFKDAVVHKDKAAVASMTKLPYDYDSKPLNSAQFIAKYDQIFDKADTKCFAKAKPIKEKDYYMVFCGDKIFCFNKVQGKWLFTEIGVND